MRTFILFTFACDCPHSRAPSFIRRLFNLGPPPCRCRAKNDLRRRRTMLCTIRANDPNAAAKLLKGTLDDASVGWRIVAYPLRMEDATYYVFVPGPGSAELVASLQSRIASLRASGELERPSGHTHEQLWDRYKQVRDESTVAAFMEARRDQNTRDLHADILHLFASPLHHAFFLIELPELSMLVAQSMNTPHSSKLN